MEDCPDKNNDNVPEAICHESDLLPGTPTGFEKLRNKLDGTSVNIKHNINTVMNGIHSNDNRQNRLNIFKVGQNVYGGPPGASLQSTTFSSAVQLW